MQRYNVLQAIFLSFFSAKLYRDVAWNWGGKAFGYLFLIVLLAWIWPTIKAQHVINTLYKKDADKIVTQIPTLTVKEGKIETPENRPYIITDPESNQKIMMIDTTGKITSLKEAQTPVLVTKDSVMTQNSNHEYKTYEIPTTFNAVLDPKAINEKVKGYVGYLWIFIFIGSVLIVYVARIIQALLYSIIGKIFSVLTNTKLAYGQILQIMMVAITPVIVVFSILDYFNIYHPLMWILSFLLAMAYLFFGILANKSKV